MDLHVDTGSEVAVSHQFCQHVLQFFLAERIVAGTEMALQVDTCWVLRQVGQLAGAQGNQILFHAFV